MWVIKEEELGQEIYSFVLGMEYKEYHQGVRLYDPVPDFEKVIINQSIMFMPEAGMKEFRLDASSFLQIYKRLS